jgi:hypothetical protein
MITVASVMPAIINISTIFAFWALPEVIFATPALVLLFVLVGF